MRTKPSANPFMSWSHWPRRCSQPSESLALESHWPSPPDPIPWAALWCPPSGDRERVSKRLGTYWSINELRLGQFPRFRFRFADRFQRREADDCTVTLSNRGFLFFNFFDQHWRTITVIPINTRHWIGFLWPVSRRCGACCMPAQYLYLADSRPSSCTYYCPSICLWSISAPVAVAVAVVAATSSWKSRTRNYKWLCQLGELATIIAPKGKSAAVTNNFVSATWTR